MHGKVCIVSDATGISDYISDGINGFVFKSGVVSELIEKMNWVFNNRDKLFQIGKMQDKLMKNILEWNVLGKN